MTDKEKIRKEVERLMTELIQEKEKGFGSDIDDACILELQNVLTYIDSLQEEPVAPKVLEDMLNAKTAAESLGISQEEHDRIVDELIYGKEPELVDVDDLPNKEKEPVSEDLEKAANEWDAKASFTPFYMALDDKGNPYEVRQDYTTHAESFKAGAEWQKQQIMKEAVDGLVICDELTHGYKDIAMHIPNNLEVGDKVRLIIIKEE